MTASADPSLDAARDALARGEWTTARDRFAAALDAERSPEALEGLGWALWWLDDIDGSFSAREEAYRLFRERDAPRQAARVAVALGVDVWDFHGGAVAHGWLARARRLLAGLEPGPEQGWLALWEGHLGRLEGRPVEEIQRLSAEAVELGRRFGLHDLEMLAVALAGHALVSAGEVEAGMRRLDEATAAALAGEISDLDAAQQACCLLLHACEQARDFPRASQWAERVTDFARRWGIRPLLAICRVHYAAVLVGRGGWAEAEAELTAVLEELAEEHLPARREALLHLGELRRRQGRLDAARQLLAEVESFSLALVGRAAMLLDEGEASTAAHLAERGLRRVSAVNWTVRTAALVVLVRARLAAGEAEAAASALDELAAIAETVDSTPVDAAARLAAGLVALAAGSAQAALAPLEDAVDLYERSEAPYEAARARLDLSCALGRAGHDALAEEERQRARGELAALGVVSLPPRTGTDGAGDGAITARESEVLGLVADGLPDRDIAARLTLSEHTVHRHVANILTKLDVPSRAAAVAVAVRRGLI